MTLKRIVVMIILGLVVSCQYRQSEGERDLRIRNIEGGLLPFNQGSQGDGAEPGKTFTLAERMAEYKIPGVSIALIDDGRVAWAKGYGSRMAGQDAPVDTGALFEAASTTKMLTAAAALRFVDQGRLDLDRDVNTYLRSWRVPDNALTREHAVTLRLLLTHRAGLNGPEGGFSWDDDTVPTLVQVLKGEPPAGNKPAVVQTAPGGDWRYSNFGYVVIQLLLEDVAGKPFPQIVHETIFKPLAMESSTLAYPLEPPLDAKEALPHDAEGKTSAAVLHPTAVAQGGLITTPSDLARFAVELMHAYQGKSSRLLSQAMARLMFQKEMDLDPNLLGFPMGEGLGVFLQGTGRGLSFLHPGDNFPGASCWLVGFPALGKGAVIMTNGAKGNLLAMELLSAIAREYRWPER
jgi:CubicO group peptidase (beta-lactamase class C family)